MADNTDFKPKLSKPKSILWDRPNITFSGTISNLHGGFDIFEMGSIRQFQRNLKREDFTKQYLSDIASTFKLVSGQEIVLKAMLEDKRFFSIFKWTPELKVMLSEKTKLSIVTINDYFHSFVHRKKLIKQVKRYSYTFNSEFVFNPKEIENADFLGMHITYVFDRSEETVITPGAHGKRDVTLEDIENLMEVYRKQEAFKKKAKDITDTKKQDNESE